MKDIFTAFRNLGWQLFCIGTLNIPCHCFLAFIVTFENTAVHCCSSDGNLSFLLAALKIVLFCFDLVFLSVETFSGFTLVCLDLRCSVYSSWLLYCFLNLKLDIICEFRKFLAVVLSNTTYSFSLFF